MGRSVVKRVLKPSRKRTVKPVVKRTVEPAVKPTVKPANKTTNKTSTKAVVVPTETSAARPVTERLFFALWPDRTVRGALAAYSRDLQRECRGKRVPAQNLHATLAFIGNTSAEKLDAIRAAAAKLAVPAFDLRIDRPGYWQHNTIAWAGCETVPAELQRLADELRAALVSADVKFDDKPFVPHVTLLRKANRPQRFPRLVPIAWRVESFALVRSNPQTDGTAYEVIGTWGGGGGVTPAGEI